MTEGTAPPDDVTIPNDFTVLRRVGFDWIREDEGGALRPSRQAFQDLTDSDGTRAMSVYVLERLIELGLDEVAVVDGLPGYAIVKFTVASIRSQGFGIIWRPDPADGIRGEAHAHVICNKSGARQKALVRAATIQLVAAES